MSEKFSRQSKKAKPVPTPTSFIHIFPAEALKLLSGGGKEFVQRVGVDVIRKVVLNILMGQNLRDSTEVLTRRRLAALNLATVELFMRGAVSSADFIEKLPQLAVEVLNQPRVSKEERWIAQWVLGLTSKSVQNVLRDDLKKVLSDYRDSYVEACQQIIEAQNEEQGRLSGVIRLEPPGQPPIEAKIDWLSLLYLLSTIGSQTLSIRGSDKSAYGKLFEKLVLGSLLHILGFRYVTSERQGDGIFWLSSRGEDRESDATLVYKLGQAARFDIGFIGRGNPEIILDKVSRYRREEEIAGVSSFVATIIIVDKIGKNSRVEQLAKNISGRIIQMSASYWPQAVAQELQRTVQFEHPLITMPTKDVQNYLEQKLQQVPLEEFIQMVKNEDLAEITIDGVEAVEQTGLPFNEQS